MTHRGLAVSVVAALLIATPGVAQDRWEQQVRAQLVEFGKAAGLKGYELTHDIITGSLRNERFTTHNVTLETGRDYAVIAACDNDCSDIDLRLYNTNGVEVDSDLEVDDYPVVEVSPPRSSSYQIRVIMAKCTENPCRYGVGIYGK